MIVQYPQYAYLMTEKHDKYRGEDCEKIFYKGIKRHAMKRIN